MKIKLSKLKPGLSIFNQQGIAFKLEGRVQIEEGRAFCELRTPKKKGEEGLNNKAVETFLIDENNFVDLGLYSTKKPKQISEPRKESFKTTFLNYDRRGVRI